MAKTIIIVLLTLFVLAPIMVSANINYEYRDFYSLIGRRKILEKFVKTKKPFLGITAHHLPTASPLLDNFYYRLKSIRPDIKTFVIIGPDHFEKCKRKLVTTDSNINTMFGELETDKELYAELIKSGVKKEDGCFYGEHSIGVQANYIKKIFPEAKAVPILLSYSAKNSNFKDIIKALERNKENIFVVESTDFTHYVDAKKAAANDELSKKWLNSLNGGAFTLKQVDSPGTIKLILELAKKLKLKPEIIEHKNSFDYNGAFYNTTSYFSVMF